MTHRLEELEGKAGQGKAAYQKVVNDTANDVRKFASITAEEHASLLVEAMKSNIISKMSGIMITPGKVGGWFAVDPDETWMVNQEGIPTPKQFNPGSSGVHGDIWEAAMLGFSANSESVPDVSIEFQGKFGELIDYLSQIEIKAATLSETNMSKYTTSYIQGIVRSRINSKGASVFTPLVDAFFLEAIGIIKLLTKMISVLIVKTGKSKDSRGWILFKYLSATIYAQMNIENVLKAYMGGKTTSIIKMPRVRESKGVPPKIDGTKIDYGIVAHMDCGIKLSQIANTKVDTRVYDDSYSLFSDDATRVAFFEYMLSIEKSEKLLALNPEAQKVRLLAQLRAGKSK